jgi:hypothetical protein
MASINISEALYGSADIRFNLMRIDASSRNFCTFEVTVGLDRVSVFLPVECADNLEKLVEQLNEAVSPARRGNVGAP